MGALQSWPVLYHIFCTSCIWELRALQRHLADCMGARREALHSQPLPLLANKRGPRFSSVPHMSQLLSNSHGSWHSFGPGQWARTQKIARLDTRHSTRERMLPESVSKTILLSRKACSAMCTWAMNHPMSFDLQAKEQRLLCLIYWHRQEPPRISTHPSCTTAHFRPSSWALVCGNKNPLFEFTMSQKHSHTHTAPPLTFEEPL